MTGADDSSSADTSEGTVRVVASGKHLELVRADQWEYVRRVSGPDVVTIVGQTDAAELLLIEQFRPPVGRVVVEFPAGLVGDGPTDSDLHTRGNHGPVIDAVLDAAGRELMEETGYHASRLTHLAEGPSSAGLTDENVHFVLAEGLSQVGVGGGIETERITVSRVPVEAVDAFLGQAVDDGKVVDPRVLAGLYLLDRHRAGERRFRST